MSAQRGTRSLGEENHRGPLRCARLFRRVATYRTRPLPHAAAIQREVKGLALDSAPPPDA